MEGLSQCERVPWCRHQKYVADGGEPGLRRAGPRRWQGDQTESTFVVRAHLEQSVGGASVDCPAPKPGWPEGIFKNQQQGLHLATEKVTSEPSLLTAEPAQDETF